MKQNIGSCEKRPNTEFSPGLFFPVFSPNAGKYAPEKARYLETFHAVLLTVFNKYFKPEPYLMDSISSSIYLFIYFFFFECPFYISRSISFYKISFNRSFIEWIVFQSSFNVYKWFEYFPTRLCFSSSTKILNFYFL